MWYFPFSLDFSIHSSSSFWDGELVSFSRSACIGRLLSRESSSICTTVCLRVGEKLCTFRALMWSASSVLCVLPPGEVALGGLWSLWMVVGVGSSNGPCDGFSGRSGLWLKLMGCSWLISSSGDGGVGHLFFGCLFSGVLAVILAGSGMFFVWWFCVSTCGDWNGVFAAWRWLIGFATGLVVVVGVVFCWPL